MPVSMVVDRLHFVLREIPPSCIALAFGCASFDACPTHPLLSTLSEATHRASLSSTWLHSHSDVSFFIIVAAINTTTGATTSTTTTGDGSSTSHRHLVFLAQLPPHVVILFA